MSLASYFINLKRKHQASYCPINTDHKQTLNNKKIMWQASKLQDLTELWQTAYNLGIQETL